MAGGVGCPLGLLARGEFIGLFFRKVPYDIKNKKDVSFVHVTFSLHPVC